VWHDGTATELPAPAGDGCSSANAVAGNGDIVGWSSLCGRSPSRAVIWRDGVPTDVQALVDPAEGLIVRGLWGADETGRVGGFGERPAVGSSAVIVDPRPEQTRVAGRDAIETGIEEFKRLAPGPRFGVVLAPVDAPADLALASFFAARRGFPLLLTGGGALDSRVALVLRDSPMFGSTVYLVGGTAVLARAVEDGVVASGFRPERVAGRDRFGTADAVDAAAGGSSSVLAVDGQDTTTAVSAVPLAMLRRASIVLTGPGHPAPNGARVITAADRDALAAELAPRPIAPTVARFGRINDGAVGAVLAARAGSPLRWVERADTSDVFLVGGSAALQAS
jgi:hypothetical protein